MNFLSSTAQGYNLSIGLKNALDILPNLQEEIQFAINEQCIQYDECDSYASLLQSDKPIFHIEYVSGTLQGAQAASTGDLNDACSNEDLSTVIKNQNLDGWVEYCGGYTADTDTATS